MRRFYRLSAIAAVSVMALDLPALSGLRADTALPAEPRATLCRAPRALDGDTITCGTARRLKSGRVRKPVRVRLIGIDAPELPGHCRPVYRDGNNKARPVYPKGNTNARPVYRGGSAIGAARVCAPGDPVASAASLAAAIRAGRVTVQVFGVDLYRRKLAIVRAQGVNLSCLQLTSGNAIYVARWDKARRIARECL